MIVTTPHSLLRLLRYQSLLFLRLCHLILDEVEVLFSEASEQVSTAPFRCRYCSEKYTHMYIYKIKVLTAFRNKEKRLAGEESS